MKTVTHTLRSSAIIVAVVCTALLSGCVCGQTLFTDSLVEAPGTRAKPIEVYYRELERHAGHSITEYKIVSGPSVPVIMFGVRGDCSIARREHWSYFGSEKIEGAAPGWTRYKLFEVDAAKGQSEKKEDGRAKYFATSDCALLFR
jgi:hypothetical protein